jgi:hypothetical protein
MPGSADPAPGSADPAPGSAEPPSGSAEPARYRRMARAWPSPCRAPNPPAEQGNGQVRNRRLAIPGLRYYIQTGRRVRNTFPSHSCTDGLARV